MYKANPASVPRSERIVRRALCVASDTLGQCVRVTLPRTSNLWKVAGVTSATITDQIPAVGVIIKKLSPTVCFVQFHGTTPFSVYSGLSPGRLYVVGTDGKPATQGDANYPVIGSTDAFQQIGIATSDDELYVQPLSSFEAQPAPPAGSRLFQQSFFETIDGVNTVFTTALKFTPSGPSREVVYYNGVVLEPGVGNDYLVSESVPSTGYDTVTTLFVPKVGDKLRIDYAPTA